MELTGHTFAGYEVVAKLGEGGMGAVYKAKQPVLHRFVALKTMAAHLGGDKEFVARFEREAASAATLNHPNIVAVYTAGEADGTHYIVMEFVDGESVRKRLDRDGKLPPREALAISIYVAQALQHAWNEARLIHRDIKPDNIFLSRKGEVKVGDLGLAKSVGAESTEMTQSGVVMGSPHYISPEQAQGARDIDFRTDIYSLGCTLYHMLTGQTPYTGDSSMMIMMKHVHDPAPAIFKAWPQCPMPLGMLVGKMLAKDRNARPQSYEQLIADLFAVSEKLQQASAPAPAPAPAPKPAPAESTAAATQAPEPLPGAPTVALQPSAKPKNLKVIYAAAGVAAVVVLAGLFLWSPWKSRMDEQGRREDAKTGSESRLQAESVSSQPAEAGTPTPALALKPPPANPKLGDTMVNSAGIELVYIPPGEFMLGSTKEEQAWAAANGLKEEEVKREGEAPRKTRIKEGFWLGRTEVTVGQWKEFVAATGYKTDAEKKGYVDYAPRKGQPWGRGDGLSWLDPGFGSAPQANHPVCCVSWNDVVAFCEWATERERKAGRLAAGHVVRLPTEAEWEYACRAGSQSKFWWGEAKEDRKDRVNWSGTGDGYEFVAPVDSFGARGRNSFGLADMLGNVYEWCLDGYDAKQAHEECYKGNPDGRVLRGGSFYYGPAYTRAAYRHSRNPASSHSFTGFRVCVGVDVSGATTAAASTSPANASQEGGILAPPEKRVSALTTNPKAGEVFTLEVGKGVPMDLMGIPPGEFMLGSTKEEQAWALANRCSEETVKREGEAPRKATIKQGFWMGRTEVTVGQWKDFVAATGYKTDAEKKGYVDHAPRKGQSWGRGGGLSWRDPGFRTPPQDNHPVCGVSWNDAVAFCEWLTERERKAGRMTTGQVIRLPTEAEWEYACRAGSQTMFWWGESKEDGKDRLNWSGTADGFEFTSPVDSYGERGRNKFGLADMLGNIYEWCLDEYDAKQAHEECYKGNPDGRVLRGGSFHYPPASSRAAYRSSHRPSNSDSNLGFRVCVGAVP